MKLFNPFKRQNDFNSGVIQAVGQIEGNLSNTNTHLITVCRLMLIKPQTLYRELNNVQANNDYVKKLLEIAKSEAEYANKTTSKENK